ncbi:MAG: hypothetical protein K2R98_03020 [Gemmataceae bacterium]|nr:hypothetical protein [Gemmataceae bacterium]
MASPDANSLPKTAAPLSACALAAWVVLLNVIFFLPALVPISDLGDHLIRGTIRLSLLFWFLAVNLMLWLRPAEWPGVGRGNLARYCWTLAWAAYVIHLGMAFHFYHHWSHADAVQHTADVTGGFGEGIYFSHFFTAVWTADVAWWWLWPFLYARRPGGIDRGLHAFLLFIIFNGTVVYEEGPIRWAGVFMFVELAMAALVRRRVCAQRGPW